MDSRLFWTLKSSVCKADILKTAHDNGAEDFLVFLSPVQKEVPIPRNKPKVLKEELDKLTNFSDDILLKFNRNGQLSFATSNLGNAIELVNVTQILGTPVVADLNYDKITSKFLVRDIPTNLNLQEVRDEYVIKNKGEPLEIRRFKRRTKTGELIPSTSVLITICGTEIPAVVDMWHTRQDIELFIDRPRNCLKCLKFNHPTSKCTSKLKCHNCGEEEHDAEECQAESKCINCSENHSALSQNCPAREREAEFLVYKCENHLSFTEARKNFKIQSKKSYVCTISPSAGANYVTKEDLNKAINNLSIAFEDQMNRLLLIQTNMISQTIVEAIQRGFNSLTSNPLMANPASSQPLLSLPQKRSCKTFDSSDATSEDTIEDSKMFDDDVVEGNLEATINRLQKNLSSQIGNRSKGRLNQHPNKNSKSPAAET